MSSDRGVRPKPKFGVSDEIEDEMLNYQELFHRSNMQPSAQVIRESKIKRQQSHKTDDKKMKLSTDDSIQSTVMRSVIVVTKISFLKTVEKAFDRRIFHRK